jgi:6-pyruvoyl tetrahydropterin synthase/QueD family protein
MLIRKLFRFENAHIVRNCSSDRCSRSIHGHSYQVEILLEAHALDNGQMIYDFGLLKGHIKDLIDSFDHALLFGIKTTLNILPLPNNLVRVGLVCLFRLLQSSFAFDICFS